LVQRHETSLRNAASTANGSTAGHTTSSTFPVVCQRLARALRVAFEGKSLRFMTLGDLDLLCTKLVALVDRGTDYQDCLALAPTLEQLRAAWPFVSQYEANSDSRETYWLPLARRQMSRLAKELGYDAIF
jgi:hypothetical protein